jgi:kynurenine formamidase
VHKIPGGSSIDSFDLASFVGTAVIADLRDANPEQPFTSSWLSRRLRVTLEDRIVLLATGWGAKRAATDEWLNRVPYVSPDGAEWLIEQKVRGVGIDHHSIGGVRKLQNRLTHELLLSAGIWIVEDLFLPDELFSLPAPLQYWGLPINLRGFSAAFCRPVIVAG